MLYDDGEEEDLNMATQQFSFCPALPLLDDRLLLAPAAPQATVALTHTAPASNVLPSTGISSTSVGPIASDHDIKLTEAVKPTALLDATNASRPLSQAAGSAGQDRKYKPDSAAQPKQLAGLPDKQATQEAAAASHACTAQPASTAETDPAVQAAAATQQRTDAFGYRASQAESHKSLQPEFCAAGHSHGKLGCAPGPGRGQKRAPMKHMAPAKRQKQLQGVKGRAVSKAAVPKQTSGKNADKSHHLPRQSRWAEPAGQVTSPGCVLSASKGKAEPQSIVGEQACQEKPPAATDTEPDARTSRQPEPCPNQHSSQQQEGQEQAPAHGAAQHSNVGHPGSAEVLMLYLCLYGSFAAALDMHLFWIAFSPM